MNADIGLIGLGVMGANLALNIAEKGFRIAVFNRTTETTEKFHKDAGALAPHIIPCTSLSEFVSSIERPRPVILLVKAGDPVDLQIALLKPLLEAGDIIIDSGNANFRDTQRRVREFEGTGLHFTGMGISGGEEGARHGPSIMVGGEEQAYRRVENMLKAVSAKYQGEPCCAWLGRDGAGHFVKTIHNGIEYADMQMIAEIYGLLRDGLRFVAPKIGAVFDAWNKGKLNSYLIEITGKVLAAIDPKTGRPVVDVILDSAGQKGTGKWAAIEAETLGVPATAIEAAVAARSLSALKREREAAESTYGLNRQPLAPADQKQFLASLEAALFAGKVAAYAQGFAVMHAASAEYDWNLPLSTIARIWRAGCIIRSQFLGDIAEAFERAGDVPNLLVAPDFMGPMREAQRHLRLVVAEAARAGSPVPALGAALGYFDTYRQGMGTANLIQAQRDFFGAHGFERAGEEGMHHGPWN